MQHYAPASELRTIRQQADGVVVIEPCQEVSCFSGREERQSTLVLCPSPAEHAHHFRFFDYHNSSPATTTTIGHSSRLALVFILFFSLAPCSQIGGQSGSLLRVQLGGTGKKGATEMSK